jgi:hypothetical protein
MIELTGESSRFCDGVSRRAFLRAGFLGVAGLGLADYLALKARGASAIGPGGGKAKAVILIWMHGGPSHFETYDPKPGAPAEYRGPWQAIPSRVPGIQLGEKLPLHAEIMDRVAVLRGFTHTDGDHWSAANWMLTGYKGPNGANRAAKFPSIGSIVTRLKGANRSDMPAYVNMNDGGFGYHGASYLGVACNPLQTGKDSYGNEAPPLPSANTENFQLVGGITPERFQGRRALLQAFDTMRRDIDTTGALDGLDTFQRQAFDIILSGRARRAFELEREDPRVRDMYGPGWGEQALLARRLIEAGSTFVTVNTGYWDDHGDINKRLGDKLPRHDRMMWALVRDLDRLGMLDSTLVIAAGEFGRTPKMNAQGGRDHWPNAGSVFVAGAGVKGGQVIGATNPRGETVIDRPVGPNDFSAIFYHALGVDPATTIPNPAGRPISLLPGGAVPTGLF